MAGGTKFDPMLIRADREQLIRATLGHAVANIPFYRESFAGRSAPAALTDLPIVDSAIIDRDFRAFCDQSAWPDGWLTTGGTTGARTLLPRSFSEGAFTRGRARERWGAAESLGATGPRAIQLHLIDSHHGSMPTPLEGAPMISLPLVDAGHAAHAAEFILEGFAWGGATHRISTIASTVSKIKALTNFMASRGMSPREGSIRAVQTYGWHLSETVAAGLKRFWGAPIIASYGLTEANAELAVRCAHCGYYHYRDAIIAEFLNPFTRRAVEAGDVELCVTTLYPFQQVSPRLRYATRDIVRLGRTCPRSGERMFEFLGRNRHVFLADFGDYTRVLFAARAVVDALDLFAWVARRDRYQDPIMQDPARHISPAAFTPVVPFGFPAFALRIDQDERRIALFVEAAPGAAPSAPEELRAAIIRAHNWICPELEDLLREGDLALACEVLPPGGLAQRGLSAESV